MVNSSWLRLWLILLAGGFGMGSAPIQAEEKTICYETWSEAAPLVKEKGLVSVRDLSILAKKELKGTVIKTTLCRDSDGELVYKIVLKGEDGKLISKTVNARQPFDR